MSEITNTKVNEAALLREMANTPGFKILKDRFEEKIKKATNRVLDMTTKDEDIADYRRKIFVWTEITGMMKSLIVTGDYTSKLLQDDFETQTPSFKAGQGE